MRSIFLDLDGPILDVSGRYHRLHRDVVEALGGQPLDPVAYWEAKCAQVPEAEILDRCGLSAEEAIVASDTRLRDIETEHYLALDRPWPWAITVLEDLATFAPLVLVTLRRDPPLVLEQLRSLGLTDCFAEIIAGQGDGSTTAKAGLLREHGWHDTAGSVFVGDTEFDIVGGRAIGCVTVALRCGIRSPSRLEQWGPDAILDDLRAVPSFLRRLGWESAGTGER